MNLRVVFKNVLKYLNDQSIDIRIRMMYFLEYASLFACFVGTICMVLLKQPLVTMIPNIILFVMSFLGLYFSHAKKMYDLSTLIMVTGCANLAVPWMYFSAGGNYSGMPVWLLFSVVVTCMMLNGRLRVLMVAITIVEDIVCICIGHFFPGSVIPLVGDSAGFYDLVQSFAVVCVCLAVMMSIYIATYDRQSKKLEEQGLELVTLMNTDALTGMFNRRAYYEEINSIDSNNRLNDLVVVAMDVNGLKKINDVLGHSAGDDYICAAARVIKQVLGKYGHIFRTGGDEFMALLYCSPADTLSFEEQIDKCIANVDASWSETMSIALGIVCYAENPNLSVEEMEKLADKRMYMNKADYYKKNGIDRRK